MVPIQFSGHGDELTPALKEHVNKKFERLQKHFDSITSIHVFFNIDKLMQISEATIHIPGHEIYAKAESEDMYKTIDLLVHKLDRQLDKQKGKSEHRR